MGRYLVFGIGIWYLEPSHPRLRVEMTDDKGKQLRKTLLYF